MSCISGNIRLRGRGDFTLFKPPFERLTAVSKRMSLAFTLIELLVVVSIIALLVSILLPSLGRAKEATRIMKCSTNLHAMGAAAHMYATNNNDYVPRDAWYGCNDPNSGSYGFYFFGAKFSPYMGGPIVPFEHDDDDPYLYEVFKEILAYKCPSFRDPEYVLTYVSNGWNFKDNCPCTPAAPLSVLPRAAAEIGYICELNPAALAPIGFGGYDFYKKSLLTFDDNGNPNPGSRIIRYDDMRHSGRTTILFFDGHAESRAITAEEMPVQLFFPYED